MLQFRKATKDDTSIILGFIKELAEYEKLAHEVVASEETLEEWIFDKKTANVLIGSFEGVDVGFCLYFNNFSTFLGKAGIYLEDLFVKEAYRNKGFGKAFLKKLASICIEEGFGRLEWACLDWNKPSIDFYLSLDARPMDEWTVYRLTGDSLKNMAKN